MLNPFGPTQFISALSPQRALRLMAWKPQDHHQSWRHILHGVSSLHAFQNVSTQTETHLILVNVFLKRHFGKIRIPIYSVSEIPELKGQTHLYQTGCGIYFSFLYLRTRFSLSIKYTMKYLLHKHSGNINNVSFFWERRNIREIFNFSLEKKKSTS